MLVGQRQRLIGEAELLRRAANLLRRPQHERLQRVAAAANTGSNKER
ncbi:MAG: hypothetical protein DCC66_03195 [Planctomycetota bacterium]|nr:MAG: hypothetical protein DCC66_03195 [Planctomycetota bacterium]